MNKKTQSKAQVGSAETNLDNVIDATVEKPTVDAYKGKTNVSDSEFPGAIKKVSAVDPHRVKTTEAAKVAASTSPIVGGSTLMRAVRFGGGVGSGEKDVSATSKASNVYKSGTREGKRNDAITRKIDFNYPQLIETERKESKPLAETDKKQGYNGNYYNDHARTQMVNGGAPGDPMFERALNLVTLDMQYHTAGQYNTARDNYGEYDIHSFNPVTSRYEENVIDHKRGTYIPDTMTVTFTEKGNVSIDFVEHDGSNRNLDPDTAAAAGDAALRFANQIEKDRLTIVAKAGDENDLNYSPLGDQIKDATAVNAFFADLEGIAGDSVFMSYRKLSQALAYQLNKAALDGIRLKGPMAEMCNGNIEGSESTACVSVADEAVADSMWRSKEAWSIGGAGLFVALHDSLSKYTSKAKLLSMPLSFRGLLETAKANMSPLRVHDVFYTDVTKAELFSTIDAPYDPLMPIVMTDKAVLTLPMSLKKAATKIKLTGVGTENEINVMEPEFNVYYGTLRNKTVVPVYNFFLKGLFEYFRAYAWKFRDLLPIKEGTTNKTLSIPVQSSGTSVSAWDCMICDATPFIIRERERVLQALVIKYQNAFGYPYTGLTDIGALDCHKAHNYSFIDIDTPLATSIASPIDSMKVRLPELFWCVDANTIIEAEGEGNNYSVRCGHVVLPHYFTQNQFTADSHGILVPSDDFNTMAYPSQRSGSTLSYLDTIYGMDEEDYRLCLDRMVTYPGAHRAAAGSWTDNSVGYPVVVANTIDDEDLNAKVAPVTYKYGFTTDGQPVVCYQIAASEEQGKENCLTILDVMTTPRELGLHSVLPTGFATPSFIGDEANYRDVSSSYLAYSGPGFTAYVWNQANMTPQNEILGASNIAYDPASSYINRYLTVQPTPFSANFDIGYVCSVSKDLKHTAVAHSYTLDGGSFDMAPFVKNSYSEPVYNSEDGTWSDEETQVDAPSSSNSFRFAVLSFQKYFWTRLQRMPFILNPFDCNCSDLTFEAEGSYVGNKFDIYDLLYYFGLAGFRASDYSQLAFQRKQQRISMGVNYTEDSYASKSLLLI